MIERQVVEHKERGFRTERYIVDSIDEAVECLLPRIRNKSQKFCEKEIRNDMAEDGEVLLDRHAGMGTYLQAKLRERDAASKL